MKNKKKIPIHYFRNPDTLFLSKDIIGKVLVTKMEGKEATGGIITETEAYMGPEDKAAHSYNMRRTSRTEVMYRKGGVSYVYLCYGMHHLFNIITNFEEIPHGILIRAIRPLFGLETMLMRCKKKKLTTNGPALLTKALGIKRHHTGVMLDGSDIWLEDHQISVEDSQIKASPRIGIDYAEEYVHKPWRFTLV